MHNKIAHTGLPFEFAIPYPDEAWINQTEARIQQAIEELEKTMWFDAVSEYRNRQLAAMTAKRHAAQLIAFLEGGANG